MDPWFSTTDICSSASRPTHRHISWLILKQNPKDKNYKIVFLTSLEWISSRIRNIAIFRLHIHYLYTGPYVSEWDWKWAAVFTLNRNYNTWRKPSIRPSQKLLIGTSQNKFIIFLWKMNVKTNTWICTFKLPVVQCVLFEVTVK